MDLYHAANRVFPINTNTVQKGAPINAIGPTFDLKIKYKSPVPKVAPTINSRP
jgi:hypothetical protein